MLKLYNTLTKCKEDFKPLDKTRVRMYVCGPTVYDDIHIGNARTLIVFDVLFRLLRHLYGEEHVIYARNITDIDDKILQRAEEKGVTRWEIAGRHIKRFEEDTAALDLLRPTKEPCVSAHITEIISLIETLTQKGHAYEIADHVLFDVSTMPNYGALSGRDMSMTRSRIDDAPYKRNHTDFVLWKPSKEGEPGWRSPCGISATGRPGWHIECSAMAATTLGETFDIHGGGHDLIFPHHENEIAQSCAAHGTDMMAQIWMHNGYVQQGERKMSKSEGNFVTVRELLKDWPGDVIKLAVLMTHYRKPLKWDKSRLEEAAKLLEKFRNFEGSTTAAVGFVELRQFLETMYDDLSIPMALSHMHRLLDKRVMQHALRLLGLMGKP